MNAPHIANRLLTPEGPLWQASINDYHHLFPQCVPDNPAKGNASDAKLAPEQLGGKDMFGIVWEYEPKIGGSTVRPGNPLLEDANDWYDKVVFPTREVVDSWDWAGCKRNADETDEKDFFWKPVICTGWFKRLISFMDFQNAAMALIDPDQADAVKDLFEHLSDLYIMLIDKYIEAGFDFDTVIPQYSGRIIFHVPSEVPETDASDEEHRVAARAFADRVVKWGRPVILDTYTLLIRYSSSRLSSSLSSVSSPLSVPGRNTRSMVR